MTTRFSEHIQSLDANVADAVSDSLDIRENKLLTFNVRGLTGSHATHEISLQRSFDNTNFETTSAKVTGEGTKTPINIAVRYVRLKVTTAEGSTSTVTVTIQAK